MSRTINTQGKHQYSVWHQVLTPSKAMVPRRPSKQEGTNRYAFGMQVTSDLVSSQHLIVDTGASHVLFRLQDSAVLSDVQMLISPSKPFASLKAANGVFLDSIGRGMLTIGNVTVTAYIFWDADLVHNLLGISPFADRKCTAVFTASQFSLFHNGKTPILVGNRHAHNLWRVDSLWGPYPLQKVHNEYVFAVVMSQSFFAWDCHLLNALLDRCGEVMAAQILGSESRRICAGVEVINCC